MNCVVCGNEADLDGDGLCEECTLDGGGDGEPERPIETVPTRGLL